MMPAHQDNRHPGEREAERLRIIMQTFLVADPYMKLQDAIPAIFETEKKTRDMEEVQAREMAPSFFDLPDQEALTISQFINLSTKLQSRINSGDKIGAIKEIRTTLSWGGGNRMGLKESKDGVEYWLKWGAPATATVVASAPAPGSSSYTALIDAVKVWINEPMQSDIRDLMYDRKKIHAIKEIRARYPGGAGLKESKDACEGWMSDNGISLGSYI